MIPGDQVPPGVEALGGDDFRAPQVVLQWFVEHYHELAPDSFYEAVVHPGECIYVPRFVHRFPCSFISLQDLNTRVCPFNRFFIWPAVDGGTQC